MTMISFAEEVAALYYQVKGYLIARNIQIKGDKGGWKDIDILAYKENKLVFVFCKTNFDTVGKVNTVFKDFEIFKNKLGEKDNEYKWILNKTNNIKIHFFAEFKPGHKKDSKIVKIIEENSNKYNCECKYISINEAINEILKSKRFDVEGGSPIGKETEILPRILKHLKKYTDEEKIEW